MAFTSSLIGVPPQSSNLGPPTNFDKTTKIGTGFSAASYTPGEIGSYVPINLRSASIANSQTALLLDQFKADGRMRVVNVEHSAAAVTATASFTLYNATQGVNIIAVTTPSITPAIITAITTPLIELNDVIQLLGTTDGSGAVTNLSVKPVIQYLTAPANA